MHDILLPALARLARERSLLLAREATLWDELSDLLSRITRSIESPAQRSDPALNEDRYDLLDTAAAARLLGLSVSTLNKWRMTGDGPEFVKLGRRIRYRHETLKKFVNDKVRPHTSAST